MKDCQEKCKSVGYCPYPIDCRVKSSLTRLKISVLSLLVSIVPYSRVRAAAMKAAGVKMGHRVRIGMGVKFDRVFPHLIYIGDFVTITDNVVIVAHDASSHQRERKTVASPVRIDTGTYVGVNSIILPSVTLGMGAVIGAGSVVTHDIPPFAVAVGNPASIVKYYDKKLFLEYHSKFFKSQRRGKIGESGKSFPQSQ